MMESQYQAEIDAITARLKDNEDTEGEQYKKEWNRRAELMHMQREQQVDERNHQGPVAVIEDEKAPAVEDVVE